MEANQTVFQIEGELIFNDLPGLNEPHLNETSTLNLLNEKKDIVINDIREELRSGLKKIGIDTEVRVELYFEKGSVLLFGLVILDNLGKIAGAISFFEYISRLIKYAIKKNISSKGNLGTANVKINLNTTQLPQPVLALQEPAPNNLFSTLNISPSSLILTITLLNIILFIGGSIYNGLQIDSIQKRYNEANDKIDRAEGKFNEASRVLQNAQLTVQSKLSSFDTIGSSLTLKKNEVISKLNTGNEAIIKDISALNSQMNIAKISLEKSNAKIDTARIAAEKISKELEKLKAKNVKFSFTDVWSYSTNWLRVIMISLLVILLFLLIFLIRLKNRLRIIQS